MGWSDSGIVQSIQRGAEIRVLVGWSDGDLVMLFNGNATVVAEPSLAQSWAQRLWTKFKGEIPIAYSPGRCDAVIRFTPSGGFQVQSEQVSHLREGFREDPGTVLQSKLLYNVNQLLQDANLPTVGSLKQVELIHARDLAPSPKGPTLLKVPLAKLVPRNEWGEFLEQIFSPGPSWVNVMVFLEGGRPRLMRINAQDPPLTTSAQFGGTMMMSWRSDLAISFF